MKRFVETARWSDPWYQNLLPHTKLVLDYIRDHCDQAGVWEPNYVEAEWRIGFNRSNPPVQVNWDEIFEELNQPIQHRMKKLGGDEGETAHRHNPIQVMLIKGGKWWLTKFIVFQYCKPGNMVLLDHPYGGNQGNYHRPIFVSLRKHDLLKTFKDLYPNVQIISSEPRKPFVKPTIEQVRSYAKEKYPGLPDLNVELFFNSQRSSNWKVGGEYPEGGWQDLLAKWATRYELEFKDQKPLPLQARPETITEKKERIRLIELEIEEWRKKKERKEGALAETMTPEAREQVAQLREKVKAIQKEIKDGVNPNGTGSNNSGSSDTGA